MGCDIHMYVERRGPEGWEHVSPEQWGGFHDRNYELFAWLAGVRNYHGQTPLDDPRGVPQDASVHVKQEEERWGSDGHSHTWLVVSELRAGLDNLVVHHAGIVDEVHYLKWKDSGADYPDSWCQGTSVPVISEADYLRGERPETPSQPDWLKGKFGIQCEWSLSGTVSFSRFHKLLDGVSKLGGPEDVRLVFWFDN